MSIPSQPQHRIFISHSTRDNAFSLKLVKDLRRVLRDEDAVWYDVEGGLHGGDTWWRKIVAELTTRNIFIVVLSADSMASEWVNDEIDLAWRQKNSPMKMRILPVQLHQCTVRADLYNLQIVSFLSPKGYEEAFNELLIALGLPPEIDPPQPASKLAVPTTSVVEQMLGQIKTAFAEQDWPVVIRKTNLLIKRAPDDISAAIYRMQGVALREEGDLQRAQEALETALTLVDDRLERLTILRDYTDLLSSLERWNEVLRSAKEALRLVPNDPGWLATQKQAQSQLVGGPSIQSQPQTQVETKDKETPSVPQKTLEASSPETDESTSQSEKEGSIPRRENKGERRERPEHVNENPLLNNLPLTDEGETTAMAEAFRAAARLRSKEEKEQWLEEGTSYYNAQEYEKALADYDRAIQLKPQYAAAYYGRGLTYYKLKEYQKAIADYDRAIQLDPQYAKAYNNRGNTYSDLKEYQKAIADYDRALQLDPNYTLAKDNRKRAYRLLQGRS